MVLAIYAAVLAATPHNRQPGLLPPHGLWRGATLQGKRFGDLAQFPKDYGVPLHIYRGFKGTNGEAGEADFSQDELAFIEAGGIYFYSTQPHNWGAFGSGEMDDVIKEYAKAIAGVAPAQVMIAPGFEPDGHLDKGSGENKDIYGTASEYRKMYQRYRSVFNASGVENAVFVLDFSNGIRKSPEDIAALYPGDGVVDWVFHNLFQTELYKTKSKGNCTTMALANHAALASFPNISSLPWGFGAWGTRNQTYDNPPVLIPDKDRTQCLNDMEEVFSQSGPGGSLPQYRAAIYFNSLESLICPRNVPYSYPELVPAQTAMFKAPTFTVNDN